ncbi:MAG: zf-HC2 domain-containing protein, partial [Acidobacteria bacterium]|nr:zf-HC2 domain-containing protein [Acidobacteriota bacterium]
MSTTPDRDRHLDELLRRAVPASSAVTPACPDAEVLAAWADGGLDALAREAAEAHVADCGRCQAVVAMLVASEP